MSQTWGEYFASFIWSPEEQASKSVLPVPADTPQLIVSTADLELARMRLRETKTRKPRRTFPSRTPHVAELDELVKQSRGI